MAGQPLELKFAKAYGLRAYRTGATMAWHTDAMTHGVSAILNVATENVSKPWPLHIETSPPRSAPAGS